MLFCLPVLFLISKKLQYTHRTISSKTILSYRSYRSVTVGNIQQTWASFPFYSRSPMIAIPFVSFRRIRQTSTSAIQPSSVEEDHNQPNVSTLDEPGPQRNQALLKARLASQSRFVPAVGNTLEDWLSIPQDPGKSSSIFFNSVTLPFKWLLWTSKALAGLPPHQSLRERLCNQSASLGSVAGLFLVIAISAFFVPPSKFVCTIFSIYGTN